jgi:ABC-type oligopeptide transport system ATPase subunit
MTVTEPGDTAAKSDTAGLLTVTDLVKHFPIRRGLLQKQVAAVQAVDGISFTVQQGETLALVGESGCGKSTTGRLLTRLEEPTAGKIVFDGRDITHLRDGQMRPLRRDIQMIFQDPFSSLNPRHTVGKIVGAPYRLQNVKPAGGIKKAVQEVLELVGLNPEHYNRYPHEFSGGQRQRIGIARTLTLKPKMIVLDEPVSALDVSIQAQVVNLLEDLQEELDLTYVFIAHDLSVVRHVADRVAVMYLGSVVEIADASLHGGADVGGPGPGHQASYPARADPVGGRRAQPDQPAARVPLPHPVLEGAGDLLHRGPAAAGAGAGSPGGVPLPGERARRRAARPGRAARRPRRVTPGPGAGPDPGRHPRLGSGCGTLPGCLMLEPWRGTTTRRRGPGSSWSGSGHWSPSRW